MTISVNGEFIDPADITAEIERMRPDYYQHMDVSDPEKAEAELLNWARENLIERTLLKQKALEFDAPLDEKIIEDEFAVIREEASEEATDEQIRQYIIENMKLAAFLDNLVADLPEITDAQCKEFYDENLPEFTAPEQIRASHIIKHVGEDITDQAALEAIREVKKELDAGRDFSEIAAENSDCPDSAGDLDYFPRGQMVEEFEQVVFNMEVGQVSDIFRTPFGYHIAKVTDHMPEQVADFEEMLPQIKEVLQGQANEEAVEKYLDDERKKATIADSENQE